MDRHVYTDRTNFAIGTADMGGNYRTKSEVILGEISKIIYQIANCKPDMCRLLRHMKSMPGCQMGHPGDANPQVPHLFHKHTHWTVSDIQWHNRVILL